MTNIREQMKQVIQSGIDGWVMAQFGGDKQPVDSITRYPLTLNTVRVYYRATMPYSAIEYAYLESVGGVTEFTPSEMQEWANYHWQYAHLELAEDFSNVKPKVTDAILERRQQVRDEITTKGYKLVTS